MTMRNVTSSYATGRVIVKRDHPVHSFIGKTLSMVLILGFLLAALLAVSPSDTHNNTPVFTKLSSMLPNTPNEIGKGLQALGSNVAFADDYDCKDGQECNDKANKEFDDFSKMTLDDAGYDGENDDGFANTDDKTVNGNWLEVLNQSSKNTNIDPNADGKKSFFDVFSMVFQRLLPGYYITPGLEAAPDDVMQWKNLECNDTDRNPDGRNANCDIPNISTEAVQDFVSLVDNHGIQNAKLTQAKTPYGLGFSKELLPTDDVPIDRTNATDKYTGLEAFGYDLHWTSYNGEWDHIKVNTMSRLKASMGITDWAKTAFQTGIDAAKGFSSEVGTYVGTIQEKYSNGEWLSATLDVLNPIGWFNTFIKGAAAAASSGLYRLLNNTMNAMEIGSTQEGNWYRPDFNGETMYSAQGITDAEKMEIISYMVSSIVEGSINETMQSLPPDTEAEIRSTYAAPISPMDTPNPDDPDKRTVTWEEWEKINKDKLNVGKLVLGVDAHKWDKTDDPNNENNNKHIINKYNEFLEQWNAAVENKILTMKQQNNTTVGNDFITYYLNKWRAQREQSKMLARPASAWVYCVNPDGTPDGEPQDSYTKDAMKAGVIRKLGKEAYGTNGDKSWQCSSPERPTIVGGLLGSSRKNPAPVDTRRSSYSMGTQLMDALLNLTSLPISKNNVSSIASGLLWVSQRVTMITNTLIGWSFQPILTTFGIKNIVINWTQKLRDSIYLSFIVMAITIAGLMIVFNLIKGGPIKAFKQIAMTVLTTLLGFLLLFNTDAMFKLIDDVPTAVERSIIGTVFSAAGSDTICEASGSPKSTISASSTFESMFGDDTRFNPDASVRTMQCKVWEAFVLTPWSYGQFNAGYDALWATGHKDEGSPSAKELDVSKNVAKLVGDAPVNLGDNTTVHNWALYQVAHTTSGTITTADTVRTPGTLDKNMYRLVDAQAGPNNAKGRDTSHFGPWAQNDMPRLIIAVMAIPTSIVGLLGIGGICLKKIQYTISVTLLLLLSPIMLLFGVLPGQNQLRLKQYGFEVLNLVLKRLCAVFVLAMALEVLCEVCGAAEGSWFAAMLTMLVICICVKFFANEIVEKMTVKVDSQAGKWASAHDIIKNAVKNNDFVSSAGEFLHESAIAVTGGVIGGALAGKMTRDSSTRATTNNFLNSLNNTKTATGAYYQAYKEEVDAIKNDTSLTAAEKEQKLNELNNSARWKRASNIAKAEEMLRNEKKGLDINGNVIKTPEDRRKNHAAIEKELMRLGIHGVVFGGRVAKSSDIAASNVIKSQVGIALRAAQNRRLHSGRTSPLMAAISRQIRDNRTGAGAVEARQRILKTLNSSTYDANGVLSKVNSAMFNTVSTGAQYQNDMAPFDLDKNAAGVAMLSRGQLTSLIASCNDPYKLEHLINQARNSGDPADWQAVTECLMQGNVMDLESDAGKRTWGVNSNGKHKKLYNHEFAALEDKYANDDAIDDEYKAAERDVYASKLAAGGKDIDKITVSRDEVLDQLAKNHMADGSAAFSVVTERLETNAQKNAANKHLNDAIDGLMAGEKITIDGVEMTREEARRRQSSHSNSVARDKHLKEVDRQTRSLRERKAAENKLANNARARADHLREQMNNETFMMNLSDKQKADMRMSLRDAEREFETHAKMAKKYENAATSIINKMKESERPLDKMNESWMDVANRKLNDFNSSSEFKSWVAAGNNADDFEMQDSVTGVTMRFGDVKQSIATAIAASQTMTEIETGEALKEIETETRANAREERKAQRSNDEKKAAKISAQAQEANAHLNNLANKYAHLVNSDEHVGVDKYGKLHFSDNTGRTANATPLGEQLYNETGQAGMQKGSAAEVIGKAKQRASNSSNGSNATIDVHTLARNIEAAIQTDVVTSNGGLERTMGMFNKFRQSAEQLKGSSTARRDHDTLRNRRNQNAQQLDRAAWN